MESDHPDEPLKYYTDTFRKLVDVKPSKKDFVSHHAVMYRPFVQELLAAIKEKAAGDGDWTEHVMNAACRNKTKNVCDTGFSEYLSYSNWVLDKHPDTVEVVPSTFIRHLSGGGKRCPDPERYAAQAQPANITFAGFEAGLT